MALKDVYLELLAHIPQLSDTQKIKASTRGAEAFEFLTQGYQKNLTDVVGQSLYDCPDSGLVMVKNIEFISLCEHHLLPMIGTCHIAYSPNGKILGLGKISEIINLYSQRLQLQEKLTHEIATALLQVTQAHGAAVMLEAKHLCTALHGVEKTHQQVITSSFLGSLSKETLGIFQYA